ncbi:hypothetical protein SAMN05216234_11916 [Hydrogenimonas thermophila]|uniref:DUF4435 domain-containing protein n=1 Tax=Hydrogenimonas thermophila TaxID=223786 RepID=A0A1I5QAK1_9BACT|nr:hypothetical protein SAMN05216234_11916 [Hydrogenimonas thermophila]
MNKLIVESKNDKFFIEKLIEHLNIKNIEIDEPLCNIDEFVCLDGISNLKYKLEDLKLDSGEIDKLGIILDADKIGIDQRLEQVNNILEELNINIKFTKNNEIKYDKSNDIEIACHILNIDGFGELEDILFQIKNSDSVFADCLESWKECLDKNDKSISEKDFIKFWISNYIRFDTCTKKEQKQAKKNCNFEKALQKDIWDFEHKVLDSLKEFLKIFE